LRLLVVTRSSLSVNKLRIAEGRAQERRRKGTFTDVPEEEIIFSPPPGWAWVRFGEVFHIRTGFAFKSPTYTDSGVLVLRVVNFDRSGAFDLSDAKYFPESLIDEKMAGFSLEEGEILMVMVGGTIGKTTRVTSEILPALLNQNMWRIRSFGKSMSNDFEYLLIRMLNQQIENLTNSTHGHFAMGNFEQKSICIPPLAEQHRIVAKVDALMALCDQLEASLTTTATTRSKLLNALLHEALEPTVETVDA
jgi:type I restriction enzyme S subunit